MKKILPKKILNINAFTIVEMIVAIVIIGVLSAISYVSYNGITRSAIASTIMAELKNSAGTLKLYSASHGAYPNSIDANYCPNSPKVDLTNCLKASQGNVLEYEGGKREFILTETNTNTGISYTITESTDATLVVNYSYEKFIDGSPGCALSEIGQLNCWDRIDDNNDQINSFAMPTTPSPIYHPSRLNEPAYLEGKTIKEMSTSYAHTCAIASDDNVYCWGSNSWDKLGNQLSPGEETVPEPVRKDGALSGRTVKSIYGGRSHTCVIADDDNAYCWGINERGELGSGQDSTSSAPIAVKTNGELSGKTIKTMSLGSSNSCAIASDDNVYCWGVNGYGQLGHGDTEYYGGNEPIAVTRTGVLSGKTVKMLSMGYQHTCVVASDEKIYCWGLTYSSQSGSNPVYDIHSEPFALDMSGSINGKIIKDISSGVGSTCVITTDDNIFCWGLNGSGQLGDGTTTNSKNPVLVDMSGALSGKSFTEIVASDGFACVLSTEGIRYCWGTNYTGQFGDGTANDSNSPVAVPNADDLSGKTIKHIYSNGLHMCAIASDDNSYCWGEGDDGNLGNNTNVTSLVPSKVYTKSTYIGESIKDFITYKDEMSSSAYCVLTNSDKFFCWGHIGNQTFPFSDQSTNASVPRLIPMVGDLAGKTIKNIDSSFGPYHQCLIASDDNAYCWGWNPSGELGNGVADSDAHEFTPVAVDRNGALSGKTIKKVTNGDYFSCAIASDDKVYCWGGNYAGQLGNGSTVDYSTTPVPVDDSGVLNGKTIKDIDAGSDHVCVIASDNKVYCWGKGEDGQLGDGAQNIPTGYKSNVPVAVDTSGLLSGLSIRSISSGESFTCAVATNNKAYCWGNNSSYQLGTGSRSDYSSSAVAVNMTGSLRNKKIVNVSTSMWHACALTSEGVVYCWGITSFAS